MYSLFIHPITNDSHKADCAKKHITANPILNHPEYSPEFFDKAGSTDLYNSFVFLHPVHWAYLGVQVFGKA